MLRRVSILSISPDATLMYQQYAGKAVDISTQTDPVPFARQTSTPEQPSPDGTQIFGGVSSSISWIIVTLTIKYPNLSSPLAVWQSLYLLFDVQPPPPSSSQPRARLQSWGTGGVEGFVSEGK